MLSLAYDEIDAWSEKLPPITVQAERGQPQEGLGGVNFSWEIRELRGQGDLRRRWQHQRYRGRRVSATGEQ